MLLRPHLTVCLALSADGKIATAGGAVHRFGSPRDQARLYALRARADAVLCGARTLEQEGALLGLGPAVCRRCGRPPLRVLVSGAATLDPGAPVFQARFSPLLLLAARRAPARRLARLRPLVDDLFLSGRDRVDWPRALDWLRRKWRVRRLLCEGGGELNSSLFAGGLVDELHLTVCPQIFGGRGAPTLADGAGVIHLSEAVNFKIISRRCLGGEAFLVFRRIRATSQP